MLVLLLVVPSGGWASKDPNVEVMLSFNKAPLREVLKLYEVLTSEPVAVDEALAERPVSINSRTALSRNEAAEFIRGRLRNYSIEIVETADGTLVAVGPDWKSKPPAAKDDEPELTASDLPAPDGYYEGTDDLTAEPLKQKLRDIAGAGHNPINYKATRHLLKQIHEDPANKDNVITIYTRESVPKANFVGEGNDPPWNREHVLPQAYGAKSQDNARSDLHNLFPSIVIVNANRDSLYFDESDADAEIPDLAPLCSFDSDSWEPPDEIKGDIARVVFYMDVRYDGSDSTVDISIGETPDKRRGQFAKLSTLIEWHNQDPVSDEERLRNNRIFSVQGNRNPFVDRPEFVEAVYSGGVD